MESKYNKLSKTNDTQVISTGWATVNDLEAIKFLDKTNPNGEIAHMFDDDEDTQTYIWCIRINDTLVGYCTLGGVDAYVEDCKSSYDITVNPEALLLGDVYILDIFQHKKLGTCMISELMKTVKSDVYADIMEDELLHFYSKFGFKLAKDDEPTVIVKQYIPQDKRQLVVLKYDELTDEQRTNLPYIYIDLAEHSKSIIDELVNRCKFTYCNGHDVKRQINQIAEALKTDIDNGKVI